MRAELSVPPCDETVRRAIAWLRQYVQTPGGGQLDECEDSVIAGLQLLICGLVMTTAEIRREMLREQNVILPAEWYAWASPRPPQSYTE